MIVTALFKEESAHGSFLRDYAPGTRIVRFWLHEPNRLADGHVAIPTDEAARIAINWCTRGTTSNITERAEADGKMRREAAGYTEWPDTRLAVVLAAMNRTAGDGPVTQSFADAVLRPMQNADRANAQRLSIQWDADERNLVGALGLRYQVIQKAEALLNDAGLLVDPNGTVVSTDRVEASIEVAAFEAAKSLVWERLTAEERGYNCRIVSG